MKKPFKYRNSVLASKYPYDKYKNNSKTSVALFPFSHSKQKDMSGIKSQSLEYMMNFLPFSDKELAVSSCLDFEQNPDDIDEFLLTIGNLIDESKISYFMSLVRLTMMSVDQPYIQQIIDYSFSYLANLFLEPGLFNESYNQARLVIDCSNFLLYDQYDPKWYQRFSTCFASDPEAFKDVLSNIFLHMSTVFMMEDINKCYILLDKITELIKPDPIRIPVLSSSNFKIILKNLLSQSVFPIDSYERMRQFFGQDKILQITYNILNKLDIALDLYHSSLAKLIRTFLFKGTTEYAFNAIKDVIESIKIIDKSGFMYSNPNQQKYIEAIAVNIENVIIKLALLVINQFPNIDPLYPFYKNSYSVFNKDNGYLSNNDKESDTEFDRLLAKATENNPEGPEVNTVTRFFYFAFQCISYCSSGFIRTINFIQTRINFMKMGLNNPNLNPFQKNYLQKELDIVITNQNLFLTYLLLPKAVDRKIELIRSTLNYLINLSQITDNNIPPKPNALFGHTPTYIFESLLDFLFFLVINHLIKDLYPFLKPLVYFFSNEDYVYKKELKSTIINIFAAISKDKETSTLTIAVPHIEELMLPSLLKYYSEIQLTQENTANLDRFEYRVQCGKLLIFWFQHSSFRNYILNNLKSQIVTDFIFHLVDDTLYFTDKTINTLKDIYNVSHEQQDPDQISEIENSRNALRYYLMLCRTSLDLMVSLATFAPNLFYDPMILNPFINTILCFFNLFVNESQYLKIERKEEINFDPFALYKSLITLVLSISNDETIIQVMLDKNIFDASDLLPKAANLPKGNRYKEMESILNDYKQFCDTIPQRMMKLEESQIDTSDAPDEFLDAITCELMNKPMKLPSGYYMDKPNLKKYLLLNAIDPFTTAPLTLEECHLDTELKQKIDEYKRKKIQEKRKS